MKNNFLISSIDIGKRLDKFLVEQFSEISRAQIQRMIESEKVFVNGKKVSKHYFLEEGDEVKIVDIGEFVGAQDRVPLRQVTPNPSVPFSILFEFPHYIIIEKPAGVVVHQAEGHPEPDTLVNGLVARYPEMIQVGACHGMPLQNMRPGIVHRLDKDVSGLMVVARTNEMYEHLKKQFQERLVKKHYIALVHGNIEREEGEIRFDMGRSKWDKRKMAGHAVGVCHGMPLQIRQALTHFTVIQHFQRYTFLKVQIKTGRTHQIRVHLNAYTHPILGDEIYRPKGLKSSVHLGRLFLHAHELGFYDLDGTLVEYQSELPKDLQDFLKTLS